MATVYIKPGTGTGTGSLADPYFYSQLGTAETAAGNGGTIYFTDGDYSLNTGTTLWRASGVNYESLNLYGAKLTTTNTALANTIYVGQNSAGGGANTFQKFVVENLRFGIDAAVKPTIKNNKFISSTALTPYVYGHILVNTVGAGANFTDNSISLSYTGSTAPYTAKPLFTDCQTITFERNSIYLGLTAITSGQVTAALPSTGMKNNIWMSDDTTKCNFTLASASTFSCFHQIGSGNNSGGTDNIFSDPLFVDPVNDDLRLRPSSPCINAGTAS